MAEAIPMKPPRRPIRAPERRIITSVEELPVVCNCTEAGLLLRRNPEVIARMAKAGELPGVKQGQSWFFRRDDLVAYLDNLFQCVVSGNSIKKAPTPVGAGAGEDRG